MSMSTGGSNSGAMSEINVTPLVDVMLVLLIIFMITAPLLSHTVTITLPNANPKTKDDVANVQPIDLAIKGDESMYFNDQPITETALISKFQEAANQTPQPELQIRAERDLEFKVIKKIMADAKGAGMVHVGFMTVKE